MRVWPLAAALLPVGFAVAELTDVRAWGGAVLVAGCLSVVGLARGADLRARVGWGSVTFALFVASHPVGREIGSWPAIGCAAVIAGAAAYALLDRAPTRALA